VTAIGSIFWAAACFLVIIGPLIFIHELGHYFVGRWFGVKAEAFSIGFGREIVGWTDRRGTRWKVGMLPLGGYVRFAGDMNPASQPSPEWLSLPAVERAKTFQAKPVWQRFLIVLAGPAVNLIFSVLVAGAIIAVYGEPFTPPVVNAVAPDTGAARAGIRAGDRILSIDGEGMRRFQDVAEYTFLHPDRTVTVRIDRAGRSFELPVRIGADTVHDNFGNSARRGLLGIAAAGGEMRPVPFAEVPVRAVGYVGDLLGMTMTTLKQVIVGERSAKEMSGPIGMARVAGQQATLGWFEMVALMAAISVNLGFINLLPIPMLDGGHLLFYLAEMIRRRPVRPQVQEWAFRSGLVLLLSLMLFVTFNDISATGIWQKLAHLIG
jgi:regulator of sigma E protease